MQIKGFYKNLQKLKKTKYKSHLLYKLLYNIFRGLSHFVLNYLYASTNIRKEDK